MSAPVDFRPGVLLQQRPRLRRRVLLVFPLALWWSSATVISDPKIEFFENKVRPVLVDHCYGCHSATAKQAKGGLRLDTRDAVLKGGDSGPALVPGDPDKSLLIKAIRYSDEDLQMPPKNKKLPPEHIAALEEWIRLGAADPRTGESPGPDTKSLDSEHWAFQPVSQPPVPRTKDVGWIEEPLDAFVLAKLEEKGLRPSPKTDKRTLIRRVTFDLTGLPPTPEEVSGFLSDASPSAFDKVVDRLLASPRYGERWARHWLDVARYADTKGYVFEEERRYPYAYTYRDYVIRAFNEDLPFDQFIIQQIAADQLPLGDDNGALAALGYLTLGRRFLNNQHDIIDDRIDVVTRGMMALTVSCARCHDHKYDPIATQDYYSLYGVFASSLEPDEKPILKTKELPAQYSEYLEAHQRRLEDLNSFKQTKEAEIRSQLRQSAGDYMLAARDTLRLADSSKTEALARERKLDPGTVQRWAEKLTVWAQQRRHPVFGPWLALADCTEDQLSDHFNILLGDVGSANFPILNPLVQQIFLDPPVSLRQVADRYNALFAEVDWMCQNASGQSASSEALEELRQVLFAPDSPTAVPDAEITRLFDVPSIQKLRALKRQVEELDATHAGAPPRAMALQDKSTPQATRILIRGNPGNPGPEVPRQLPAIFAGEGRRPFEKGSGRLELGQAIASSKNPLTARVLVNRIWIHHFGAGLVGTASDFGLRSEKPSHPELLDYLAARFMAEGWSVKKLHRWIVLSSTYQQTSDDRIDNAQVDPSNRLLWKMNRRRLDMEAMRDSLLSAAGSLNFTMGGHPVDILAQPFARRRTVYGFVERQNLPGFFRTFDFASPDTTSPQRFLTTVPQQALFMINSPFIVQQARSLIDRAEVQSSHCAKARVHTLYQIAYQRRPDKTEEDLALGFVTAPAAAEPSVLEPLVWQHGYGEYDVLAQRVKAFNPLPHFTGDAWQGGSTLPDATLGWAQLRAAGGHPGNDCQHAVVRRWIAPRDLAITISGTLAHDSEKGDGVQGWIVSNRRGELGAWTVKKRKQATRLDHVEVQRGETIDFIVACGSTVEFDGFTWAPVIKVVHGAEDASAGFAVEWNAKQDFSGPRELATPLSAWERYAQVLLMSNEFVFVD